MKEVNWVKKIMNLYPMSLIIVMVMINFNEGLMIMKAYAIKNMFKAYYHVEPSVSINYQAFIMSPSMFKVLTGILVDAKLI